MVARSMQSTTLFISSGPHESRAAICPDFPGAYSDEEQAGPGVGPHPPLPNVWNREGLGIQAAGNTTALPLTAPQETV